MKPASPILNAASYGLNVIGMIAVFTYEFNVSKENLNNEGIKVKTLVIILHY